jgi:thymidylate synthase ThyX
LLELQLFKKKQNRKRIPRMESTKILADSLNVATGDRITTFELKFPKCLLAELGTHRMLSKNAGSSRAIPIKKVIEKIKEDPYIPQFTRNQRGMQGEIGDAIFQVSAKHLWMQQLDAAIKTAIAMDNLGVHKQNANRVLEPWMYVPVIITGTEWDNFFNLRCAEATHPDFRAIAQEMRETYKVNHPRELSPGEWHIPFSDGLMNRGQFTFKDCLKIATARAARVSYTTHDGKFDYERDFDLHDMLLEEKHQSPFEHSAMAMWEKTNLSMYSRLKPFDNGAPGLKVNTRNFQGFLSYRAHLESGINV